MLQFLKNAWSWIENTWNKFELWVAGWVPGLKVKLVTAAGAVGSGAAVAQQWISGLPLDQIITAKTLAITNVVLFSLAFWFRRLTDKSA